MLALVSFGCGQKGGSSTTTAPAFLPHIDLQFPDNLLATEAELTQSNESTSVIESLAQRIDHILTHINILTNRLNVYGVNGTGRFEGKGPDGIINGYVSELTSSAYNYRAVICSDETVIMQLDWSADGQKIHAIRDFSTAILAQPVSELVLQLTYDLNTLPTLDLHLQGKPFVKPIVVPSHIDFFVEHVEVDRDDSGSLAIKAVADWYSEGTTQFTADTYLTGSVATNGSGSYVAYRKFNTLLCPNNFDENNLEAPGWCLGRDLDSDSRYNADERLAAWAKLKTLGIVADATLNTVSLDPDLTCSPE